MSSSSSQRRLRLSKEIHTHGFAPEFACDRCFLSNKTCIVMESAGRLRCSECVRIGRPCVSMSWESLDRTREEYTKKVDESEQELARVLARLMREKAILRQAEKRAKKKAGCLASEMEAAGELETAEDCPAAAATSGLSPAVWGTLDMVDDFLQVGAYSNASLGTGVSVP